MLRPGLDQKRTEYGHAESSPTASTSSVEDGPSSHQDSSKNAAGNDNVENMDVFEEEEEGGGTTEEAEEEEPEQFNPYQFISLLPVHSEVRVMKKICLPPLSLVPSLDNKHNVTLVLDLDETLVHCTVDPVSKPDLIFPVE